MFHVIKQIQRRWPANAPRIICGPLLFSVALLALGSGLSLR
jgi:hypothetical protein